MAKPDRVASRSTSRAINAVVALPWSIPADHGPLASAVARNRGPSGLKIAVMAYRSGSDCLPVLRNARSSPQ